ncbi:23S rRNA (guanosine(2251)-2'-O)-methyltransferase RlmB [Methylomicrobium sp. Wu6]|uniref:23S rRNA (guanosine(2251)-2'-O)-methyltransferase RlmB n=1 Tax=Methylomicrobium sp. Wu6 TaxID=3107928 RepID=UPI002DD69AB7|nr:23S rRNA (guanosine(2251)-2'-O)-methyltransferase RlmB [Methylomicrobium sp. Wu6]MEC4750231.1 23S rRNA (guanosine(2251)-2'-O)-methyltransferase RlmB [Methylomicrobium sp. Wu6]
MKLSKIFGLHAVQSALQYSPHKITQAWIDVQRQDQRLARAIDDLEALGIVPEKTDRKKLDRFAEGNQHQGIVIEIELPGELPEHNLKTAVQNLAAPALFLVLDHVQDPHNFGACLRTADATGVNGVIVTKDNAAGITPTVCKVSSGAAETVPVYQVTNLARTLRWLKEQGIWVFGAAGESAQPVYQADLSVPMALVIGAEGKGLRRLTQEACDMLVALPMRGSVESLNLSVATGVLLYEVLRQRMTA